MFDLTALLCLLFTKHIKKITFAILFAVVLIFSVISYSYAQYLCGSTGLVYSDQNFCNKECGATYVCEANATISSNGTLVCSNANATLESSGICVIPNQTANSTCPSGYALTVNGCSELTPVSSGSKGPCPSGFEGFIYDSNTQYTYAVSTSSSDTWFTYGNQTSNNPSLAIIPDANTNQVLQQILQNYNIPKAWIGIEFVDANPSANIPNSGYYWWNYVSPQYTNFGTGNSGAFYGYMNASDGTWGSDGVLGSVDLNMNSLVQWNGPLDCVNGVTNTSSNLSPTQSNAGPAGSLQYCNGTSPCYMCADTSQCIPQNECSSGFEYNSTNNDCESPPSCPTGGTLNSSINKCVSQVTVACPNNYTFNSTNNDCEASASPSCNSGGTISGSQCVLTPSNGCPAYYSYNSANNDCEDNPSPQCPSGSIAEFVGGQNMCVATPNYTCSDSGYAYNTLVSLQCAAQPNVYCPSGGAPTTGYVNCLSTTTPCPTGYTLNGAGQCTAPITITCSGSGIYNETLGYCIESAQPVCPSGFTYNSSISSCTQTPPSYSCPGSGSYNSSEGMCSTSTVLGCPTGYTVSGSQCVAPVSNNCPLPGSYNSNENMCSAQINSHNCSTGYVYNQSNNDCESTPSCPSDSNLINGVCSAPLQPCSPTSQNFQECVQTATGWLCPLNEFECTPTNTNQFTHSGVTTPGTYSGAFTDISISGMQSMYDGYVSFYNYYTSLPAGTYNISLEADNEAWLYINGTLVATNGDAVPAINFTPAPTTATYQSNGGYIDFFIALMNGSFSTVTTDPNPTGVNLTVTDSKGNTVVSNSSHWEDSLDPSDFDYSATCPTGYAFSSQYNACVATATPNCVSGYTYNSTNNDCESPPSCPTGGSLSNGQCVATPSCPNGGAFNGNVCVLAVSSYSCPAGGTYNGSQCVATPQCPSGYTYSSTNKDCEMAATINCQSPYVYNGSQCVTSPSCPSGYTYSASAGGCTATATCPSGYSWNGSQCIASASVSCPPGGSYNGSQCVASGSLTCPNGGTLSGTTCSYTATANTTYSCPSGGSLSGTTCTDTTVNSSSTCVFDNQCDNIGG